MVKNTLRFSSLYLLLASASLYAAEPVGKVLMLQGAAVAMRGTQELQLVRGTAVEKGDLLRIAEGSSLQVRFTDESVVALRANTQFKIDDYKFTEKGDGDTSIFSLIKGGMRTITGLIGKRHPDAYQMRGSTATIGIRGTHFTAVSCASDCTNADGSKAADGLYGSVTDGRIIVRNESGETEFVRDQYFMVPSSTAQPKQLLAPPSFLRDRLDGLARAPKALPGRAVEAPLSGASVSSSTAETTSPAPSSIAMLAGSIASVAPFAPAASPAIQGAGPYSFSETTSSAYARAGIGNGSPSFGSEGSYYNFETHNNVPINSTLAFYMGAFSMIYSDTDLSGTRSGTKNKTASIDIGSSAGAEGVVSWGRYQNTKNQTAPSVDVFTGWEHWAIGTATTARPTSGIFTFVHAGGTQPTDQNGNVGTLNSGGAWTFNFGTNQISTASNVVWTMGAAVYTLSIPTPIAVTFSGTNSSTGTHTINGLAGNSQNTSNGINSIGIGSYLGCTGCSTPSGSISPQFNGATATGLAVAISTTATVSAATQTTALVQVYKR